MLGRHRSIKFLALSMVILGLTAAIPAQAFRMIQSNVIGMSTSGSRVACDDRGGFAHWEDHSQGWWINTASVTTARVSRVNNALSTWTAVTGSDYFWFYFGTSTGGFGVDGRNSLIWTTGVGCSGGCLALTSLVLTAGQVIVESDITLRSDIAWSTDGSTPRDLESTLAHEFGHSIGIHHTDVTDTNPPTMRSGVAGTARRTLEDDDRAAIRCSIERYGRDRPGTTISYRAHVKGRGWLTWVQDGATAGTTGESRRMEAAQMRVVNGPSGMGVCYQAHVRGKGWLDPVCNGSTAGTTGQHRRMEAIKVWLTNFPEGCDIEYRAHVAGRGWLPWVRHSQVAGTTGQGRRMEAMQARFVGTCN